MKNSVKTRNWWAVFVDYVGFGAGLTFAHTGTVLPAFAATLTNSKVLIGLVGTVWLGAWLLPQLFAANYLSNKPHKYGYMVRISAIGRPVFWLFALLLTFGWLKESPGLLLVLFLASLAWFSGTDAIVAICWFDIYGRALDPKERGQLIGVGQVVDGLVAIAAGALVAYLLSARGPAYPYNYATIFGLAGMAFLVSWIGITFMVEVPEDAPAGPPVTDWRQLWAKLLEVWKSEPRFSRAIWARLLLGLSEMAAPFYIIHATQVAHVDASLVGSLAAVGSIGSALAGLWLGRVAARQGSHRVIQLTTVLALVPPVLGLVVAFVSPSPLFIGLYIGCYLILGMVNGSSLLGYFNYILDLAPPGGRPIFMGIANTMGGLLVIAPALGGWVLENSSYGVLFTLTLAGVVAATVVAAGLRPASHMVATPVAPLQAD
jgi:MFS family permease